MFLEILFSTLIATTQTGPPASGEVHADQEITLVLRHRGRRVNRRASGNQQALRSQQFDMGTLAEYLLVPDGLSLCLEEGTSVRIRNRDFAAVESRGNLTSTCMAQYEIDDETLRGSDTILIVAE